MTARFGRNKRRRAREQIAAIEKKLQDAQLEEFSARASEGKLIALLDRALRANRLISHQMESLQRLAANGSVLCPPQTFSMGMEIAEAVGSGLRFSPPQRLQRVMADLHPLTEKFDPIEMEVLEIKITNPEMDRMIHARLRSRSGHVAYGISINALRSMWKDEVVSLVAREIAPALAQAFVEQIRNRG